jgi:hypothetical protein
LFLKHISLTKAIALGIHCITLHGKPHEGTVFIIRNDNKHYEINKYQRELLQAINIMVEGDYITISAVYSPEYAIKKEPFF